MGWKYDIILCPVKILILYNQRSIVSNSVYYWNWFPKIFQTPIWICFYKEVKVAPVLAVSNTYSPGLQLTTNYLLAKLSKIPFLHLFSPFCKPSMVRGVTEILLHGANFSWWLVLRPWFCGLWYSVTLWSIMNVYKHFVYKFFFRAVIMKCMSYYLIAITCFVDFNFW